jgi:RNA polymerase sigma-70 factor (ECF subfamily)
MEPSHDDKLVARYLVGDLAAFDELIERYRSGLFSYLRSMVGSKEDAEDLLQETFLRVIAALPRYRAQGKFRAWIYRIARNLAHDRARKIMVAGVPLRLATCNSAEAESGNTVFDLPDAGPSPRDVAISHEKRDWIDSAVQDLPEAQKEVFVLRQYVGMPFKDIAALQRRPIGTVLARMHYALDKLRTELHEERESY